MQTAKRQSAAQGGHESRRARSLARRVWPPLWIAYRRTVARLAPAALVALGIAVAAAALATIWTARVVVEDRAVADAVSAFPPDQRAVVVSWVGSNAAGLPALDREARNAVGSFGMGRPTRALAFRSDRLGGEDVRIVALDDPAAVLDVRSGRAPEPCRPGRCELVAVDAPGRPLAAPGFEVVGRATAAPGAPLDALVGSQVPGERLLVANGVDEVSRQPELASSFRTVTWLLPLRPERLGADGIDDLERQVAEQGTRLRLRSPGFDVRAPLQELSVARERAEVAGRRQLLVAGQLVALFLAFAVLAASRLRHEAHATQHRLRRFGALRWQVLAETTAHTALVVVPSVVLGWLVGTALGGWIAAAADRPVGATLERSSLSTSGVWAALALAVVAVVAVVVTIRARGVQIRGLRVTVADVAAVGAIAAIVAAFGTGQNDVDGSEGSAPLLLLLPVLVAFAGAVIAARLLGPLLRAAEHLAPRAGVSLRLALLSLVRTPGAAALAVVFLVVTTGLAVFAATYRATLAANQRDTAAFAVPLDYIVSRDAVRSRGLGAPAPLASSYREDDPVGIVRRTGEAPTLNRNERLTVLGVPATALERLRWRDDYADRSQADLASALSFGGPAELRGVEIPRGTRELAFPVRLRGDPIRLTAQIRRPDGSFGSVELRESGMERAARLPAGFAGGRIVGLTLEFPPATAFSAAHAAAEARAAPEVFVRGRLRLGRPVARGAGAPRTLPIDYSEWVSGDGAGGGGATTALSVRYLISRERDFRVRPRQVTDGRPVPVIASESIASAAGGASVLPLDVGDADLDVAVAATAARFPTVHGDFVIADRDVLETALNAAAPGVAVADEVWLDGPPGRDSELRDAAPVPVSVVSRSPWHSPGSCSRWRSTSVTRRRSCSSSRRSGSAQPGSRGTSGCGRLRSWPSGSWAAS